MGILICGLNGTGKSSVGRMLADRLGYEFIDNEDLFFPKDDSSYVHILINPKQLSLLMIGTQYPSPDCIQVRGTGKMPINHCRQQMLARVMEMAGWKIGYRYTVEAKTLPIAGKPALCFYLDIATKRIADKRMA